jgi:hypothetical protein
MYSLSQQAVRRHSSPYRTRKHKPEVLCRASLSSHLLVISTNPLPQDIYPPRINDRYSFRPSSRKRVIGTSHSTHEVSLRPYVLIVSPSSRPIHSRISHHGATQGNKINTDLLILHPQSLRNVCITRALLLNQSTIVMPTTGNVLHLLPTHIINQLTITSHRSDDELTFNSSTRHSTALLLLKSPLLSELPRLRCTKVSSRFRDKKLVTRTELSEHPTHRICGCGCVSGG